MDKGWWVSVFVGVGNVYPGVVVGVLPWCWLWMVAGGMVSRLSIDSFL